MKNSEQERLSDHEGCYELGKRNVPPWEKWGPYVANRGWGTVREDYSADGDAWRYFPHEHAHLRTYRRVEDSIAGISDRFQVLLFAPAFWNGVDPILKERLFGLNAWEGNHGEDVKECYYTLDATPTHSYLQYLYKYPHTRFPYEQLREENRKRGIDDPEFELLDTGIFEENRYFDIFIEYAKSDPEDLCIRIEAFNRGPEEAPLHILPHLWFRNQWAWGSKRGAEPKISLGEASSEAICLIADDRALPSPKYLLFDYHLGQRYLYATPGGKPLFTGNETNRRALWQQPNDVPYVKDAFHRYLIQGEKGAIRPEPFGTKASLHYFFPAVAPGKSATVLLRLSNRTFKAPLRDVEPTIAARKKEADLFYEAIHPLKATEEEKAIQRQALAGMLWNQQIYLYDVGAWLEGDRPEEPPPPSHKAIRNFRWRHIVSMRLFSMPDKWEYPWFAAWDLVFHSLIFSLVNLEFAKNQLWLLLYDQFQHPNGAIPACEWEFSDVNPPLQAWAALKIFNFEKTRTGREDFAFLEKCFHKLLLNFSWWINQVDPFGNNVFEGGFLGMDNIGFFDRSQTLPAGYLLDQADGVGWISLLCLNLMRMALTLARKDPIYEGLAIKFFHHFIYVTASMRGNWRNYDMWNDEDGFFYSFLRTPDGRVEEVPIRSLVGIVPFFACDAWEEEEFRAFPNFYAAYEWIVQKKPSLAKTCLQQVGSKHLFSPLKSRELERFLKVLWDPEEFRSEYGLRSLSKFHEKNPAKLHDMVLTYEPGEARERIKGGNSNWRGPIWFPLNFLLIDALFRLSSVFRESLLHIQVGKEPQVTLAQMAESFAERLLSLFKRNGKGERPFSGEIEKLQKDPHFKDYFLFYEHFHGETGRGLGASHHTGWTGLVANLIDMLRK